MNETPIAWPSPLPSSLHSRRDSRKNTSRTPPSPQKCGAFILNLRKEVKVKLTEEWGVRGAGRVDQLGHKPALRVRPRGFALYGCKIWM